MEVAHRRMVLPWLSYEGGDSNPGQTYVYGSDTTQGTVIVTGGNDSTTPLTTNIANVLGGGTNGGTLNLYGGQSSSTSNNQINIGTSTYPQNIAINGNINSNLNIGGDIIPTSVGVYTLGNSTDYMRYIYTANLEVTEMNGLNGLIYIGTDVVPITDNAISLGGSGQRWSEIWAGNGTMQTSDAEAKRNTASLDQSKYGLTFINKLKPTSWQWKDSKDTKKHLGFVYQDIKSVVGDDNIGLLHDPQELDGKKTTAGMN